jgi:hypothetical protein
VNFFVNKIKSTMLPQANRAVHRNKRLVWSLPRKSCLLPELRSP